VAFYDILVLISLILWIIFGSGLIISLILIVPRILRAFSEFDRVTDAITNRMLPIMERIDGTVQDVAKITDAAMASVERIDETVGNVTDSVERMLDVAEERVSDVNALVTVAVEEAEDTFLSTAGILRAIRGRDVRKKRRDRRQPDRKNRKKRKDRDRWLRGGERRTGDAHATLLRLPAFQAIGQRDLPVVRDIVLFMAAAIVAINFIVDMTYTYLDPRLRND